MSIKGAMSINEPGVAIATVVAALLLSGCQGSDALTATPAATQRQPSAAAAQLPAAPSAPVRSSDPMGALTAAPELPESPADAGLARAAACGVERQPVKTGQDAAAGAIDVGQATATTVGALGALAAPVAPGSRVKGAETTLWTVHATLTAYKREADSDYHLALVDDQGSTMIAELVDPHCLGGDRWAAQITAVRAGFDRRFTVGSRYRTTSVPVTLSGIGFFDKAHGQRGMAPNAIELHPVLALTFDS